ncbi:hypothetical protein [Prochlorococcus marinus]|uniref:hypothetical protein n=1 Tax=Prochlorococcus marinus TaxID=1219 RepID=UPI0022B3F540|nr:hypothetical protein [Prochlorococcus marinus]
MKFFSELCHVDSNNIIVRITGYENNEKLGSSLGQASNVKEAEELAINSLVERIQTKIIIPSQNNNSNYNSKVIGKNDPKIKTDNSIKRSDSFKDKLNSDNKNDEPQDWSKELSQIEVNLKRIGWSKAQENDFIEKTLGYKDRNRITEYQEIILLIKLLQQIREGEGISSLKRFIDKDQMILLSDNMIKKLGWDLNYAREYLKNNFSKNSRSELENKELLKFNLMLISKLDNVSE